MENLDAIIENYKKLSTDKLISLAEKPSALRIEIIPYLQSELLNRDKKEEALSLSEFLVNKPRSFKDMSEKELEEMIRERMNSGESIESIKLDLKDNGVDLFEVLATETKWKDETFDYIVHLKEEGWDETSINEKMEATYGITENETEILKSQLKSKGKQNLIIGYSIVVIMILFATASFAVGGGFGIGLVLLTGVGVWRIAEGYRQRK